jgi:hypothetical protein
MALSPSPKQGTVRVSRKKHPYLGGGGVGKSDKLADRDCDC